VADMTDTGKKRRRIAFCKRF